MKSYHQFCGVAKALDLIGERWTLLLIRDLLLGPLRYRDLLDSLPGITTNLLAARLRAMTDQGLIAKVKLPPPAGGEAYQLTPLGRQLEPAILALGAFGAQWLTTPATGDCLNPRWAMTSLKRRFQPRPGLAGSLAFHIGELSFQVVLTESSIDIRDGDLLTAEVTVSGPPMAWLTLLSARDSFTNLTRAKQLHHTGPIALMKGFLLAIGARP